MLTFAHLPQNHVSHASHAIQKSSALRNKRCRQGSATPYGNCHASTRKRCWKSMLTCTPCHNLGSYLCPHRPHHHLRRRSHCPAIKKSQSACKKSHDCMLTE
jgi:hypothetical protein